MIGSKVGLWQSDRVDAARPHSMRRPRATREKLDAAEGVRKADLVLTGGQLVNVVSGEVYLADVAITGDMIAAG